MADNRLEVRVRSFDERELIQGLQKVANRITQGLLIAALVVGWLLAPQAEARRTTSADARRA